MRYYCTYFDRHYLIRGLTLYYSLERQAPPFQLWVLCFDQWSFDFLTRLALPNLIPVALDDFEQGDSALRAVKAVRSRVEYIFTCSPSWPLYLLNRYSEIDVLTYLDADLYFFSSPEPIYEELGENSLLIVGHRFPKHLAHLEIFGIYNVGLLSFRNDDIGHECLQWWRARCLEWCGLVPEDGKFADQKYLDDWPARFPRTHVLQHSGAGLAPWNWMNFDIRVSAGSLTVNGQPLIFYHYHGIKFLSRRLYDPILLGRQYGEMPHFLRRHLYPPYVAALKQTVRRLRQMQPDLSLDLQIESERLSDYGWRVFLSKLRRGQLMFDFNR